LGPTKLTNSPGFTSKEMFSRARSCPSLKDFPTLRRDMMGSAGAAISAPPAQADAPTSEAALGIAQQSSDGGTQRHEHDDDREIAVHLEAIAGSGKQATQAGLRHGQFRDHGADGADSCADAQATQD